MQTLYIVDSNWSEAAVASAYASLLPAQKQRVNRMCESGKAQLTVSLFVRLPLLALATSLPESELVFSRDKRGKLWLPPSLGWEFNVADTSDCVVLGVARQPIGVDVECKDRSIVHLDDFVTNCLSSAEQRIVSGLNVAEKKSWVLRAWVLKEAYTKRLGIGLSFGFQRITVSPDPERPTLVVEGDSTNNSTGLVLWANYLNHYIALSTEENVVDLDVQVMKETDFFGEIAD